METKTVAKIQLFIGGILIILGIVSIQSIFGANIVLENNSSIMLTSWDIANILIGVVFILNSLVTLKKK